MPKLVLASERPLAIGEIGWGMSDPRRVKRPNQPFRVVGESTEREWLETHFPPEEHGKWKEVLSHLPIRFYEIETD